MDSIVMPRGKDSQISYRVKCVLVESERVFGDVLVTRQTRNGRYWVNTRHYPEVSERNFDNLTKQVLDTPDFMALNGKPNNRRRNVEVKAIMRMKKNRVSNGYGGDNDTADGRVNLEKKQKSYPLPILRESVGQEAVVSSLVDQLLLDIYGYPRSERGRSESDSTASSYKLPPQHRYLQRARLLRKSKEELSVVLETLSAHVNHAGGLLVRQLRRRDYLVAKRDKHYDVITAHLQAYSAKRSEDTRMRFSLTPQPGESGFTQWLDAMKMVARLQGGIPQEFRKRLWLTLAERHLEQRGVDWKQAEKLCFNEWSNPDDEELGIQIVKDLHRTGCSLFCGAAGRDNQAVLRRVLLGFARWNKSVGYCQGLNVLAALVLQVTDRAESSAVKVMIYLIEGVLPEGYFADNLRGLSIDMAVFRDLLRMRLPKLSRHLEALQSDAKDKATGSSYEPPLTNVFTMQWFLTLFCHCLPQEAVLRVWDLIFLEGDEVLLRTALAIWEGISDRIMTVTSADEFYSIMGVLTREMLEFTDVNNLIKTIVNMGPLYGVTDLREKHRYNITPWARRLSDEEDTDTEDEERLAVAAAMFGVSQRFKKDRSNASSSALQTIGPATERERIALDISTLKHQYAKLRERQRQAHIILSAACARQSMVPSTSQAMNHLLVGKSALVSVKTRQLGPPPGAIPPKPRTAMLHSPRVQSRKDKQGVTLHWKDTKKPRETKDETPVSDDTETITTSVVSTNERMSVTLTSPKRSSATDSDSDSTSTELCDEPDRLSDIDSEEPTSTSDCYIMATDDEKSPRPGASPIVGDTANHQTSEQQTSKNDFAVRIRSSADSEAANDAPRRELLDVAEASSIASIIDQIRRLSSSDDVNEASMLRDDTKKEAKNEEKGAASMSSSRNDDFREADNSIIEELLVKISPVRDKTEGDAEISFNTSAKSFEKLDSYDFLSSRVNEKLDAAVSESHENDGIVKNVSILGAENSDFSDGFQWNSDSRKPMGSESAISSAVVDSLGNKENGTTPRYEIEGTKSCEDYEINGLKSNGAVVANSSNYEDDSAAVAPIADQSETIIGERALYSRSYVVGYLPIAPTTVSERLGKGVVEISPLKENVEICGKEIGNFESDVVSYASFDSVFGDEKIGKTDEGIYSREVGSFDTDVGKKINNSFESDSPRTLGKDSFASFVNDVGQKINNSFESVSTSEKVSKGADFLPTKDDARSFISERNFDDAIRGKINTSFESVSASENDRKIVEFSSMLKNDERILAKDAKSFDNDVETKIDASLESVARSGDIKKVPDFSPISDNPRFFGKDIGSFESEVSKSITSNFHTISTTGKSSKIAELPATDDVTIFGKEKSDIVAGIGRNNDIVFDSMRNPSIDISPVNKSTDAMSSLTETDFSSKKIENVRYDIHKTTEAGAASSAGKTRDDKVFDSMRNPSIDISPVNKSTDAMSALTETDFSCKKIENIRYDIHKTTEAGAASSAGKTREDKVFDSMRNPSIDISPVNKSTDAMSALTETDFSSKKIENLRYDIHKTTEVGAASSAGKTREDKVFDSMRNPSIDISPVNKSTDAMSALTETDFSSKKIENLRYDIHKTTEAGAASSAGRGRENKIVDLSPLSENFGIWSTDIRSSEPDIEKRNSTFDSMKNILSETKITDSFSSFTGTVEASNKFGKIGYEMHKSLEATINSSASMSAETKVANASQLSESLKGTSNDPDTQNYSVEKKVSTNSEPKIGASFSDSRNLDEYSALKMDSKPTTGLSISSLNDRKKAIDDRRIDENFSLIATDTGRLNSEYNYRDSLSRTHDETKKSPKTPESAKSFSSGETMGPDSKASSLATSPRTPNRVDSRNFAIDKSARSSVSSDSKTLTLRSMDSEAGGTRTKLDRKSEVARTSLDKSSPSTPLSTDSLKNKSEISPKFIISSSSESCSPGKAKSSDRSFSSELQSPISANSIKFRTNYTENQDNLSETSMDICSATSPFYPIVYPNQKTPSPYGATGKQRNNADSVETSPEQKSISSKEETPSGKRADNEAAKMFKSGESARSSKDRSDEYDSARPFEKELAETLSALPSESIARTKNERISSVVKDSVDLGGYGKKKSVEAFLEEENSERYMETDTVSPLPGDKYENRSAFVDKAKGSFKSFSANERDEKYLLAARESFKPFERSCSSLEKRFAEIKSSPSTEEFGANTHKKRSSDILEDLRHLEAKSSSDGKADTSMLTRKTGYDWEDLKNLEARRQDNFSDSASEFSRDRLDVPRINVFGDTRKSYVVEPKINLAECSILKNYARKKSNGEPDDDRESKLGVWTKVKPRAIRPNGRRSSDRALKIIQENSAILHKILTCQAKKRLPDLEEISKEITISPINEEISKIFSPILEKMGLNEHEINEELARINFKDFDQMTATSGSEFDAKMNDELSKLSLIDDNEIVDHLDVDDVISRDYLDTREALIDRQINEELSKLLANYEESSPIRVANRDESSSCQNPSELEGLELSSISTNVFSYQSSNDSIETKSELGSIQDTAMQSDIFAQYGDNVMSNFAQPAKYAVRGLSPRSDIDIYRELEKLDKISSGEIFPAAPSSATRTIISPISYATDLPSYAEVRPSSLEYRAKVEKSFDPSPMKSPYDTYKPYDFKSRISPRKTPSNPYSARAYEKSTIDKNFEFHDDDHSTTPSRLYDLGTSRPILSKETLEFRVRYDDDTATKIRDDDLSLEPYQTDLVDLERGASYYTAETPVTLKRLSNDTDRSRNVPLVSPLDYPYNPTNLYSHKYEQISPKNYSYPSPTTTGYEKQSYNLDEPPEVGSYLSMRRKNSQSLSPNYQYADRDFAASLNPYGGELATSLDDESKRPVSRPEFVEKICVPNYAEVSSRDSLNFRKASLSLGPLDGTTSRTATGIDATPSPRSSLFSPFPVRNPTRKRKELGLKLGLYSPSSPGSASLKRS